MARLQGQRVLVVGASSGIGRAVACAATAEGAQVAAAARRAASLEALVAEGGAAHAVALDVCDEPNCEAGMARAVELLGGLDAVVYSVGVAFMHYLGDVDADQWRRILDANVTGAATVARATMPPLEESRGRAVFLSSISAEDLPPRRGLGPYMVSKAALNKLVEVLQIEHKRVRFTRVSVGDTMPTDFASGWDMSAAGELIREWGEQGVMFGRAMDPTSVARHVVDVLCSTEGLSLTRIVPAYAVGEEGVG